MKETVIVDESKGGRKSRVLVVMILGATRSKPGANPRSASRSLIETFALKISRIDDEGWREG